LDSPGCCLVASGKPYWLARHSRDLFTKSRCKVTPRVRVREYGQ
jgi:hypothetical protein